MNTALTISICLNVFQAITFWVWTCMLVLAYKQKMEEVQELKRRRTNDDT